MMKAPQEIFALVARFEQNLEAYQSGKYNETQIRREFIDPFFKVLGWDVENTAGYAEAYKDVIHEDAIKIGSVSNAPDYSFRIGGTRKFFVEAKKPSVNIAEDIGPAYQVRRYAWSAKLPLSILTDFEEFAVYDCRVKPDKSDKASTARIIYMNYKEYLTRWEEIASVFSKEAVMKGSFDKYAESAKAKKGTAGVDAAFLAEIDSWRQALAQNIALRNPKLSQRELNYSVGKTIDRIIFLRICEDRGIEPYGQLMALQNGANVYKRLTEIYYNADDKYNSGLFHFKQEKDRFEPPDDLTLSLSIDDKILKDIFKSLYYPESPYEFSVLPADILGQVYEQFLGKVIHLTPGHRAKVEEKPEVRKAGGVYYTPTYIVDYIVKNTVGKLLEGKTPKTAEKLRILDPACGSGSFLIGAYQYLLDWHRDIYIEDGAEKHAKGKNPKLYQRIRNEWRLTTAERKRILLNNIYGVDIDPQAVEVTKLSLLLKVLEGESDQTIKSSFKLFHERALPDLGNNIKCGNSLIGPDYYEGKQTSFLDTEEMQRVNAFDWEKEFPGIFKAGGFDAVIGNPPYSAKKSLETKILMKFFSNVEYKCDPYAFFIEQGMNKLKIKGYLGFIVPVTWMTNYYYMKIRKMLIDSDSLDKIVLIDGLVFENANVDTCMLFLNKNGVLTGKFKWLQTDSAHLDKSLSERDYSTVRAEERYDIVPVADDDWNKVRNKIDKLSVKLGSIAKISLGMKLRANDEFVAFEKGTKHPDGIYFGADISRYGLCTPRRFFDFSKAVIVGGTKNPKIQRATPKILIQAIRNLSLKRRIVAAFEKEGDCFVGTVNAVTLLSQSYNIKYILGIINSTLANTYFRKRFTTISLTSAFLGQIPIPLISISDSINQKRHDKIIQLVDQMLNLNKQLAEAKTDHEKTLIQRQIDATDKQIDKLVYELYELTPEEIKIVEEK